MAAYLQLFIQFVSVFLIATSIVTSTSSSPPSSSSSHQEHDLPTLLESILTDLGYQGLAAAAPSLSNSTAWSSWRGPVTVFATTRSLHTCDTCTVPLILQEHTARGLFPWHYLRTLAFSTYIPALTPGRCIKVTSFSSSSSSVADRISVGDSEITNPDLFNNGLVVVHGLGFWDAQLISSSLCGSELMIYPSLPPPPAPVLLLMDMMIKDAILRLRVSRYKLASLALIRKYSDLMDLQNMTIFALDDASFSEDTNLFNVYVYGSKFSFHVIPNRRLMAADLEKLPLASLLPTMEPGQELVVTNAGGVEPSAAPTIRINDVKIMNRDVIQNLKIVIHGVSEMFPHIHPTAAAGSGRSMENAGAAEVVAPTAPIRSTADVEDRHGL